MFTVKRLPLLMLVLMLGAPAAGAAGAARADADDYFREGKKLQQAHKWDQAEQAFSKAMELEPGNAAHVNARALLFMDLGDVLLKAGKKEQAFAVYAKALEDVQKAVDLDPLFTRAWNNAGVIANRIGENRDAIDFYTHAIECDPGTGVLHHRVCRNIPDVSPLGLSVRQGDADQSGPALGDAGAPRP